MTIYQIKSKVNETGNNFFDRKTMKFFGQTMKSFRVAKLSSTTYRISAPIIDSMGNKRGESVRIFNSETNELTLGK